MLDMIGTKKYEGQIKPGTYLRASGNGQQLLRVRSVNPDGTGTVETYGILGYGSIKYPKRNFIIRPCIVYQPGRETDWGTVLGGGVEVETGRYNKTWSYSPVDLVSRLYDPADAYSRGENYIRNQMKLHSRTTGCFHYDGTKMILMSPLESTMNSAYYGNPFNTTILEQSYKDGVNEAAREYLQDHPNAADRPEPLT